MRDKYQWVVCFSFVVSTLDNHAWHFFSDISAVGEFIFFITKEGVFYNIPSFLFVIN